MFQPQNTSCLSKNEHNSRTRRERKATENGGREGGKAEGREGREEGKKGGRRKKEIKKTL